MVEVNRSFKVAGWELHQSSYQALEDWERYLVTLIPPGGPTTRTLELSLGQRRPVPGIAGTEVELSETQPPNWIVYRQDQPVSSGLAGQRQLGLAGAAVRTRFHHG